MYELPQKSYLKTFKDEKSWLDKESKGTVGHSTNCSLYWEITASGNEEGTKALSINHEETLIVLINICWKDTKNQSTKIKNLIK